MPSRREARPGPVMELVLGGQPESELLVRDLAGTLGFWMGLGPARVEDLKTAVCEAFLNAVEHGNAGSLDEQVRVVFQAEPGQLVVIVTDGGRGRLPDDPPHPGHPDRVSGWGLYFMRELMDRVDWQRLPDGRNEVRMVMRLATASAGIG
jgi:serine/threonine-protein kinase RsbW